MPEEEAAEKPLSSKSKRWIQTSTMEEASTSVQSMHGNINSESNGRTDIRLTLQVAAYVASDTRLSSQAATNK